MKRFVFLILILAPGLRAPAQLTTEQRLFDFRHLANTYAQLYAPYEWKRDALKFDALDIAPWLDRLRPVKNDLGFYETCVEYVASLRDPHDSYQLPSTFVASLGFTADIYDGKVVIDSLV